MAFWRARGALPQVEARRRLTQVVCLLRKQREIVGTSSVYPAEVRLIGGRRFWIYRSLLDPTVVDYAPDLIRATFSALQVEFDSAPDSPIGLCVLVGSPDERRRRPQAVWPSPQTFYAGYLADGRQVRLAYFKDASISRHGSGHLTERASGDRSRIHLFAEQDRVTPRDVIELWTTEAGLTLEEAERRVGEILLVACDGTGNLGGVCTAYLQQNEQLRAPMWYLRVFVAAEFRRTGLALELALTARDHLSGRFASGEDPSAPGIILEVENPDLKRQFPNAVWPRIEAAFIGEDDRGRHIRVYYFPGALAPEPE